MIAKITHRTHVLLVFCVIGIARPAALGQPAAIPPGSVELAMKQSQLADRYRQLESLLLKMAEYDSSTNPRRAALLRQALSQGKERRIGPQLNELVNLFQREQLQQAVEGQSSVQTDLKALLDLLLSENRPDRLKSEQARIRDYIKQLDRIVRQQKSIQGRTEAGESEQRLSEDQGKIAVQTKELGAMIDEAEATGKESEVQNSEEAENGEGSDGGEQNEGQPGEQGESQSGEQGESQPGEQGESQPGEQSESQPGEQGESQSGEQSEGQSGEQSEGQPGEQSEGQSGQPGQQSEGQQGQPGEQSQQQQDQQFPGRKRIAAAEDRMRQAQERLEQAEREDAVTQQEEAKRLLEQAKAELEEILRQLREEEIERVLALLEGRFRKMLEMEMKVRDDTVRLSKTPAAKRTRQFTVNAGKLSLAQRKIVFEADKALTLLREEGSSVAFPEATEQIRSDMQIVARRLAEEKVGSFTQSVQDDIVAALEEMIEALQKAQQEAEERRQQQQQQQQQGDPSDQPLVDKIAELKMIRALQMRVNTRTQRYAKMLTNVEDPVGQATDDDLLDALRELSDREQRIYDVTSDIVLEKNK